MEIIIGIIGIIIGLLISIIPYFRNKYIHRPEITMEIKSDGGMSLQMGLSSKNELNKDGNIDGNNAIRIFELTWLLRVKITNNSEFTAFYPELEFNPNGPKLKIDNLNRLQPIKPAESIELSASYKKYEEARGIDRTQTGEGPPVEFKELELLLGYENSKKRRFYTLFDFSSNDKRNIFLRKRPKYFA